MSNQPRIPDPEVIKRHVEKLREVVRMYDDLNLLLDEAIAQVESDFLKSPYHQYQLAKTQRQLVEEKESSSS